MHSQRIPQFLITQYANRKTSGQSSSAVRKASNDHQIPRYRLTLNQTIDHLCGTFNNRDGRFASHSISTHSSLLSLQRKNCILPNSCNRTNLPTHLSMMQHEARKTGAYIKRTGAITPATISALDTIPSQSRHVTTIIHIFKRAII